MRKRILCWCLILFSQYSAMSQGASISGRFVNELAEPVSFTTISVMNSDSSVVAGAISEDDGYFLIKSIEEGDYFLTAQHIEYEQYSTALFSVKGTENKRIGTISLNKASIKIDEVLVKGKRALVEVHSDKMVFNVASSPNASGNNGLELLNKAPGIVIDPDNNIILQGKSGVRVFINGRPSSLSGTDLASMLQSMQSDNILQIEIITNPSARYEAEGNAGIINIKLKNNTTLGYNGNWISNYSRGSHPRMNHGISMNYGKKKVFANLSITRFDDVHQEDFVDVKNQNDFIIDLGSYEVKDRSGFNVAAGLDYKPAKNHSIGIIGRGIFTKGNYELNSTTDIFDLSREPIEKLVSQTLTDYKTDNQNYSLSYQWDLDERTKWFTDLSYGSFGNDRRIDQPNDYYFPNGSLRDELDYSFEPYTTINLWSVKSDFDKEYDRFSFAAGAKYTNILTDNEFVVNDVIDGEDIKDLDASNDFSYREEVLAAFATAKFDVSKKLQLNAGLRVEHTRSNAELISEQTTNNDVVERQYTDFFPNISLSFNDGKKNELSIGVGRRVTRPNYQDLNPFESKLSELALFKGNPFLNPNYITNYQISYVFNQKLVVSNTYSITEAFFAKIVSINETKGTIVIPRNMDKAINNGLTISYPQEITNWWDLTLFAGYNYSKYQGEFDATKIDFSQNIYNARMQNNLDLPWGINMELTAYYRSPFVWRGTVIIDEYWGVNFGLKKSFWNDRLQLRITGSDIFNTNSDYGYYGNYGGLEFDGVYSNDNHRFGAGLTFKFGNNQIKRKSRKSGLDEELRRIAE